MIAKIIVEKVNDDIYLKRGDLYKVYDVNGIKAIQGMNFIDKFLNGREGVTTAGLKSSPQTHIISNICYHRELKCRIHTGISKKISGELYEAGRYADVIGWKYPRSSVINAKARKDAEERNWLHVPFGMQHQENVDVLEDEVLNIPKEVKTIIIPLGSGISCSAIINGCVKHSLDFRLIGVKNENNNPLRNIRKYSKYPDRVEIETYPAQYSKKIESYIDGIHLDPIYEAKAWEWARQHWDEFEKPVLFWIIGVRNRFDEVVIDESFYTEIN